VFELAGRSQAFLRGAGEAQNLVEVISRYLLTGSGDDVQHLVDGGAEQRFVLFSSSSVSRGIVAVVAAQPLPFVAFWAKDAARTGDLSSPKEMLTRVKDVRDHVPRIPPRPGRLDETEVARSLDSRLARDDTKFAIDGLGVGLDRVVGDVQLVTDLPLGQAGGEQPQNIKLAIAERLPILGRDARVLRSRPPLRDVDDVHDHLVGRDEHISDVKAPLSGKVGMAVEHLPADARPAGEAFVEVAQDVRSVGVDVPRHLTDEIGGFSATRLCCLVVVAGQHEVAVAPLPRESRKREPTVQGLKRIR